MQLPFLENFSVAFSTQEDYIRTRYFCYFTFTLACIAYLLKRVLLVDEMGQPPKVYKSVDEKSPVIEATLEKCSFLSKQYKPTWLWGKSGHVQTLLFGLMSKTHKKEPASAPSFHSTHLQDGTEVHYTMYQPVAPHKSGQEFTLLCVPGIFGNYYKCYMQSLFGCAVQLGYRCVSLNHLGCLKEKQIKTPRLFTYGSTDEYRAMCAEVFEKYPNSKFIAIGFSMGGNIVCKYLGEEAVAETGAQDKFVCAVSICQGYDCWRANTGLSRWDKLQVMYSYILAQRWVATLEQNPLMITEAEKRGIKWKDVKSSRGLSQFDTVFTSKFYGYSSLEDFAHSQSCCKVLQKIKIPLLLVNAEDDPLIGPFYHDIPRECAQSQSNVVFVETRHGGHLGYFESGLFLPKESWIDQCVLEFLESYLSVVY